MKTANLCIAALIAAMAPAFGAPPVLFHDHGHGLSFSSDGKLLLAPSHEGLAVYDKGVWREMGGAVQGFSGFSVTENAIYSSGHARPGASAAASAGLLRSRDGGRTWQPLALAGQADFRMLAAGYRSGAIYVLNARPSATMPSIGIYVTLDDGGTWRRAAALGLKGEVHGLAAHPVRAGLIAVAAGRGLYLSRDGGETFRLLDGRELATAVAFDAAGARLRYARGLSNDLLEVNLNGRDRRVIRAPQLRHDYITCLTQNPSDGRVLALATRKRDVYLSADGGASWLKIAESEESDGTAADENPRRPPE